MLRRFSITGAKVRIIFEYASVLQKKCRIISSRSTERGIKNASAFKVKRPCVCFETSLRLNLNALAFFRDDFSGWKNGKSISGETVRNLSFYELKTHVTVWVYREGFPVFGR